MIKKFLNFIKENKGISIPLSMIIISSGINMILIYNFVQVLVTVK